MSTLFCRTELDAGTITCYRCGRAWPVRNGIPRFIESNGYWGEISRPDAALLTLAASRQGWRQAVSERFAGNRDLLHSLLIGNAPPGSQ